MTSWIIPLPFVLLNLESVEQKGKNRRHKLERHPSFYNVINLKNAPLKFV